MKKTFAILILLCISLIAGCSNSMAEQGSESNLSIFDSNSSASAAENTSFVSIDNNIIQANIKGEIVLNNISPTGFSQNIIFYEKENDPNGSEMSIRSYDIISKKEEEVANYDLQIAYDQQLAQNGHLLTMPLCADNEVRMFDCEKNSAKETYKISMGGENGVYTPFYWMASLSGNKAVFLNFTGTPENDCSNVYTYNYDTSEVELIYSLNGGIGKSGIDGMATYEDNIYLLLYEKKGYSIIVIDSNGNELRRDNPDLSEFIDFGISSMTVTSKEYVISFSVPDSLIQHTKPVVIDKETLKVYSDFDKMVPGRCISNMPINGRYILFESQPDFCDYSDPSYSSDLCEYDMESRVFKFVDLNTSGDFIYRQILSDENGSVIVNNVVKGGSEVVLYRDAVLVLE